MKKSLFILIVFLSSFGCTKDTSFQNPNYTGEGIVDSNIGSGSSNNKINGSYTAMVDGVPFKAETINVITNVGYSFNGTSSLGVMAIIIYKDLESGKTFGFSTAMGNSGSYMTISGGDPLNSFFTSGELVVEEFDAVEGLIKATFSAELGSGVKITDGVLDFKFPVVNEDDINAGSGDCINCNQLEVCKGGNGNAFLLGYDSGIKYETYLANFNCK